MKKIKKKHTKLWDYARESLKIIKKKKNDICPYLAPTMKGKEEANLWKHKKQKSKNNSSKETTLATADVNSTIPIIIKKYFYFFFKKMRENRILSLSDMRTQSAIKAFTFRIKKEIAEKKVKGECDRIQPFNEKIKN